MPKRTSVADATPIRVVVVTLDSHLASAAARARAVLRRELPGLELDVHAADEWGEDEAALARCRADIARGDIVIGTMLFLEDHIRAVLPALEARRNDCDAMLCCMSAGEVVKLTRLGNFDMSEEALGAIGVAQAAARQPHRRESSGQRPDEDAAAVAAAAALHSRHGAGRARLFPRAAVLARGLGGEPREPRPNAGRPLRRRPAHTAARQAQGGDAGALSRRRALSPERAAADLRTRRASAARRQDRHGRPAGDAVLRARRQHRALRRRHRRARGEGPAGAARLRQRPRCAAGDRALLHEG